MVVVCYNRPQCGPLSWPGADHRDRCQPPGACPPSKQEIHTCLVFCGGVSLLLNGCFLVVNFTGIVASSVVILCSSGSVRLVT